MTLTTIASIIVAVLTVVGGGFKLWSSYVARRQANADREAGANEVKLEHAKETADADRRAADVVVNASRGDAVDDALASGKRQF